MNKIHLVDGRRRLFVGEFCLVVFGLFDICLVGVYSFVFYLFSFYWFEFYSFEF